MVVHTSSRGAFLACIVDLLADLVLVQRFNHLLESFIQVLSPRLAINVFAVSLSNVSLTRHVPVDFHGIFRHL